MPKKPVKKSVRTKAKVTPQSKPSALSDTDIRDIEWAKELVNINDNFGGMRSDHPDRTNFLLKRILREIYFLRRAYESKH